MSSAVLRGYYGRLNAGDDAFLLVSAWGARTFFRCDTIFATAANLPCTHGLPIHAIYTSRRFRGSWRWDEFRDRQICKSCDTIIFGGGSNFHSAADMELYSRLLVSAGNGPHAAVGVSIGPFKDKRAELACREILNRLDFIGVRDRISYQRSVDIAPGARVELTFDIAPLLPLAIGASDSESAEVRRGLGVCLCPYESLASGDALSEQRRVRILANAINKSVSDCLVDEVILIDFNGESIYGDSGVHYALASLLDDRVPVRHVAYCSDPAAVVQLIRGLRGIIAMRLHAAVFAFMTETPTLLLAYHEKCHEWGNMVDHPHSLWENALHLDEPETIAAIAALMSSTSLLPTLTASTAIQQAMKNWSWLGPAMSDGSGVSVTGSLSVSKH